MMRTLRLWLALAGVALLHGALTCYFVSPRAIFADRALQGEDFDLHAGQVLRVSEGLARFGKSWVYDVSLLAGQPEGTILDASVKGWELWTHGLSRLGVPEQAAFNSFVLLVMLAAPLVVLGAASLFQLSPLACLLAAALSSMLWFFDSFFHWLWWVGMISYAAASYLWLVPLALFHRFVGARGPRRALWLLPMAPSLGLVLLVHPYSFFALLVPLLALYLRAARKLANVEHAGVAAAVLVALAINAYWLRNALAHAHYVLDSAYYAQGGLSYVLTDFFGLLQSGTDTGFIGTRTGFRVLVLGLAAVGIGRLRHTGDPRALPLGLGIAVPLLVAYLSVYLPGGGQTQPYRNIAPACLLATLPAGQLLARAWESRSALGHASTGRALGLVAALVLTQHLAADVLYFVPRLLAEARPAHDGAPSPLTKYGFLVPHPSFGTTHVHYGLPHELALEEALDEAVAWVAHSVPAGARVLVEHGPLGERIARKTQVEVIGGFRERNVAHAEANLFRSHRERALSPAELARYLTLYNVHFVLAEQPRPDLDAALGIVAQRAPVAGFTVYRTLLPVRPIVRGHGTLRARTNRIEVDASVPSEELLLAYHFHEALRCTPGCRIERAPIEHDRVGLIRVLAPHPARFAIVNGY